MQNPGQLTPRVATGPAIHAAAPAAPGRLPRLRPRAPEPSARPRPSAPRRSRAPRRSPGPLPLRALPSCVLPQPSPALLRETAPPPSGSAAPSRRSGPVRRAGAAAWGPPSLLLRSFIRPFVPSSLRLSLNRILWKAYQDKRCFRTWH